MIAAVADCFSALKSSGIKSPYCVSYYINREISRFCGSSTWKLCSMVEPLRVSTKGNSRQVLCSEETMHQFNKSNGKWYFHYLVVAKTKLVVFQKYRRGSI